MAHPTHLISMNDTLICLVILSGQTILFPSSPFISYIRPIAILDPFIFKIRLRLSSHCQCCFSYLSYLHLLPRYYNILLPVLQDKSLYPSRALSKLCQPGIYKIHVRSDHFYTHIHPSQCLPYCSGLEPKALKGSTKSCTVVHAYLSSKVLCSSCPRTPPPVLQAVFEFLEYATLSPEAAFTLEFPFCIFHTLLHRVHFLHGCSAVIPQEKPSMKTSV